MLTIEELKELSSGKRTFEEARYLIEELEHQARGFASKGLNSFEFKYYKSIQWSMLVDEQKLIKMVESKFQKRGFYCSITKEYPNVMDTYSNYQFSYSSELIFVCKVSWE